MEQYPSKVILFMPNKLINQSIIFCTLAMFLLVGCSRSDSSSKSLVVRKDGTNQFLQVSKETAKSIDLKTQVTQIKKVSFNLRYNGTVKEVPNKSFFVASPVNGSVLKVLVEPNQVVKMNQELAEISSQDIAEIQFDITKEQIDLEGDIEKARLDLDLAKNSYDREQKLFQEGITAKKEFLEVENRYKTAQNNLEILEKKKKSISELAEKRLAILGSHIGYVTSNKSGQMEIRSPLSGIILKRIINPGEVVEKDKILFEASDLSEVFLESKIYEKDLPDISLGKKVTFTTEACPDEIFHGEINYIAQTVDPDTRTVVVRARIQNPTFKLKPEMYGKMFISLSDEKALVISKEAVQRVDNDDVVYLKTINGFKEIKIKLGKNTDGLVEVVSGLKLKQEIVTQGSFWLKSELHTD